jgi:RNA polymerase sigma-70 factor (ECF subfamily)
MVALLLVDGVACANTSRHGREGPARVVPLASRGGGTETSGMSKHAALKRELVALLPRLRRFAISLARNLPDADDLVQEACIRAIARADDWDPEQGLDRWTFRILRNLWVSETRKDRVRLGAGRVDAAEAAELRSEATGESHLAAAELMGRLAALPAGYAEVLLLVAIEGYSYAEAAELLDIPQGTVMSRIHRARQILAEQLKATRQVS